MVRVLTIVALVVAMMATGVAGASPATEVRVPVSMTSPSESTADSESVIVVKGDHLWKISAHHLGPDKSDAEIVPYWRDVVEINTPQLRSGDPDLIYPGEVIELP